MGILRSRTLHTTPMVTVATPAAPRAAPVNLRAESPRGGLLGLLPEVGRDVLGVFTWLRDDYGDLVRLRLGFTPTVLVSHPQLVEEVLVTHNADYRKNIGARRLGSLLGNGLLLSEGDFWLRQRRLMQPAFHRQRLASMVASMVDITASVLDTWRDGEVRDVSREMTEITLRIAARTLFGTDVADDVATMRAASLTLAEHFRSRLFSMMILLPDAFPSPGNRRYQRSVRNLNALVYRIIGQRHAPQAGDQYDDLLDMLLAARDEAGQGMTDRQLRDEVMTLLLAGHDTTALATTWTLVLLAQHPEVEARLLAEVDSVLGGRLPTVADAPRLPYTEHVFTESLRLYPTAWAIGREAIRDTSIGGQRIRKGTNVLMSPWVIHRDPRFYDQPDVFNPDRWADGLEKRLPRFAYVPFGGGQRVCIGSSFAQLESTLLLAQIAQRFHLALADPARPVEPLPVVTLRPREAVPMRLSRRSAAG
jgi:cytochrome P450